MEHILFLLKVAAVTMNLGHSALPVRYRAGCECRYAVLAFVVLVDKAGKDARDEGCRDRVAPRSVLHIPGLSRVLGGLLPAWNRFSAWKSTCFGAGVGLTRNKEKTLSPHKAGIRERPDYTGDA
jgi:hypothetical protein